MHIYIYMFIQIYMYIRDTWMYLFRFISIMVIMEYSAEFPVLFGRFFLVTYYM